MKKSLIALAALCVAALSFAAGASPPAPLDQVKVAMAVHAQPRVQAEHDQLAAGVVMAQAVAADLSCMPAAPRSGMLQAQHLPSPELMRSARHLANWGQDTGQALRQT